MTKQVISKQRVADHGEVFTSPREVNAMLDLVKQETERIDSRFLEPACGTGNFLTEILTRKLGIVEKKYRRSQLEFERNLVLAMSSIYGIDILEDNILECRQRLFEIADQRYTSIFKKKAREEVRKVLHFILSKNIIHGNALTLKTVAETPEPITFAEWAMHGSMIIRRDFIFEELIPKNISRGKQRDMFNKNTVAVSDLGEEHFDPKEIRHYPSIHFLRVGEQENA